MGIVSFILAFLLSMAINFFVYSMSKPTESLGGVGLIFTVPILAIILTFVIKRLLSALVGEKKFAINIFGVNLGFTKLVVIIYFAVGLLVTLFLYLSGELSTKYPHALFVVYDFLLWPIKLFFDIGVIFMR